MAWRTTASADADIVDIEAYGALTVGRRRAEGYVDDLFVMLDLIASNPHLGRERDELPSRPRLHTFRAHHILYLIEGGDILVLRILGHRQDWLNLL